MPVEVFGPWLPDLPALGNPGVTVARNVFPAETGYEPVPAPQPASDALANRPLGALRERDNAGAARSYAGTAATLEELIDGEWTDISKMGGYATGEGERWEFMRWGNKILATNFSDSPQSIAMGGANFADLTTDFKCRCLGPLRNFVLAGSTTDSGDGEVRSRLRWCAFNDETDWTPDPATQADFEDLQTGGGIVAIRGGEIAVVFQESSIRRVAYVGGETVMQIDEVLPGIGALSRGSIAQDGRFNYFLSTRGFVRLTDGTGIDLIGSGKVDKTVLREIDGSYLDRISAARDPLTGRVMWLYPGPGNTAGRPNRLVVFDPRINRWALIEIEAELVWSTGGTNLSLDTDDPAIANDNILDAINISFDSPRYKGSSDKIGIFGGDFRSFQFDSAMPMSGARIETAEQDLADGARTRLRAFRPLVEGGAVTMQTGFRNDLGDAVSWGAQKTRRPRSGRFTQRSNARYRRLRLDLSGNWTRAIGLQVRQADVSVGGDS